MLSFSSILSLWSIQAILVLCSIIICHYLFNTCSNRISRSYPEYCLIQAINRAIRLPGLVFIWLWGIFLLIEIVDEQYSLCLVDTSIWMRAPLVLIVCCWFTLRLNTEYFTMCADLRRYQSEVSIASGNVWELVQKAIAVAIVLASALILMPMIGLNIGGLLALGGVGGIVAGFAARDLLSSIFRGALLHIDQMFMPGEYIRIAEKSIEGVVEHIGWLKTTIRTPSQTLVYLPNTIFDNLIVENIEQNTGRRFHTKLLLKTTNIELLTKVTQAIETFLKSNHDILKKSIIIGCTELTPYGMELEIQAITTVRTQKAYYQLQQTLLIEIANIIENSGIKLAQPSNEHRI